MTPPPVSGPKGPLRGQTGGGATPATPSYKVSDLDGCEVVTESGEVLGLLKDVYATGANDVFAVRNEQREYLIPARNEVVLKIDLKGRRIEVRLPPGLREIYET